MNEYVSKQEFNITTKMMSADIEKLTKTVDKVVDKVGDIDIRVERHEVTLVNLDETVGKLDVTLTKMLDQLQRVDKQTDKNTQSIQWNWKTILASGAVITILISTIATMLTG